MDIQKLMEVIEKDYYGKVSVDAPRMGENQYTVFNGVIYINEVDACSLHYDHESGQGKPATEQELLTLWKHVMK